jgi:hypothetical protein
LLRPSLGAKICRHTARAVAGNLRLGAVGVNQPNLNVRLCVRIHPLDTVRADAIVAVTNMLRKCYEVRGGERALGLR